MDLPHFPYRFIFWWTLGLPPCHLGSLVSIAVVSEFSLWPEFQLSCFALLLHRLLKILHWLYVAGISQSRFSQFCPRALCWRWLQHLLVIVKLIYLPSSFTLLEAAPGRDWMDLTGLRSLAPSPGLGLLWWPLSDHFLLSVPLACSSFHNSLWTLAAKINTCHLLI